MGRWRERGSKKDQTGCSRDRDNGKREREEAKKTRQAAAGTGTTGRGRERKQKGLDRQKIGSKSLFSPQIPDRRETSDIPGLPLGGGGRASPSCLESQGCHLIPLSYILSCLFLPSPLSPFCRESQGFHLIPFFYLLSFFFLSLSA